MRGKPGNSGSWYFQVGTVEARFQPPGVWETELLSPSEGMTEPVIPGAGMGAPPGSELTP